MEAALSAFLGDIVQRSISFLVEKLSKEAASLPLPPDEHLRRKLLRVRIIVLEAEGRQIRNEAMLDQLKILRAGLYEGYYVLDAFQHQRAHREEDDDREHEAVSHHHSFAISRFNPAKRVQLWGRRKRSRSSHRGGGDEKEMHQVIGSLEMMITDAREFVMFLAACPPLLNHQPYSTYQVMEKCMFGRHVEMEHIINFLMEKQVSPGTDSSGLDVLPIVGPMKAGKSTLAEQACNDERVRRAFSRIVFFTGDDLDQSRLASARYGGTVKHQRRHASGRQRLLLIVELDGDIDEATWSSLYSASKMGAAKGSKFIICSRSDEIARFGTTRPLRVEYPTREAYWYFFKALAFGSANPEEEPRLAAMAVEIAECMNSSFIAANMMARMLRANFSVKFWRMAVSWIGGVRQENGFIFGGHPVSPWQNRKPAYIQRINNPSEYCWIFDDYQVVSAQDEAHQEITLQKVLLGMLCLMGNMMSWCGYLPYYLTVAALLAVRYITRRPMSVENKHIPKS